jgi:superfamily II DNA or RNA helicase
VKVIDMPTGSGKTWVQALIAKHYLQLGKKVTIVEPNENLES